MPDGKVILVSVLKAENARLKNERGRTVSLKVSGKGGVSVYGLGRFPVTLYKEQWTKLLAMTDEISLHYSRRSRFDRQRA